MEIPPCDFCQIADIIQLEKDLQKRGFMATKEDMKKLKAYFPKIVQAHLDSCGGIKQFDIFHPDYDFTFLEDREREFMPELRIKSRRFNIPAENYQGTVEELARYAWKRLDRYGISNLVLNLVPDALQEALIRSDDFFHDLFHPVTSRVGRFLDEAFD